MLKLVNVHTYYGDSHVLHGVSLGVEQGSVVALLGRNGMGKTTTIRSIIGFTPPRQGEVYFEERNVAGRPAHEISGLGIGLVPQGRRVFPSLSVEENLLMCWRSGAEGWKLANVYELFPILRERRSLSAARLSGGEQQMLAVARALMLNPKLLLMDEPTEGLAPIIIEEVAGVIKELKQKGLPILLVEQNIPMALEVADFVYILSKGKIVFEGTTSSLRDNPDVMAEHLFVGQR